MFLQVPLLEEWTVLQVLRAVDVFGAESGANKTPLVERAMVCRVVQHGAELLELIILDFFDRPILAGGRESFEFAVTCSVAPALRQLPVNRAQRRLRPARHRVIGLEQRIEPDFQAHGVSLSRYTRHHSSNLSIV